MSETVRLIEIGCENFTLNLSDPIASLLTHNKVAIV